MESVLLLSCDTGQGHNSCARAVKEYFEDKKIPCEIQDSLNFISDGLGKLMSWGHSFMYKILTIGAERLYCYIASEHF